MKTPKIAIALAAGCVLSFGGTLLVPLAPAAAMPVFDATNYAQNLLQAARALEQINHQIASLQNEAAMLRNMGRNLERIDFPQLERVRASMQRIDQLMGQARGIGFRIDRRDAGVRTLLPGAADRALRRDQRVVEARARVDAASESFRQAMRMQAQVVENVRADAAALAEIVAGSQNAVGSLQASQAANQLLALSIAQQLQVQNLMASEFRTAALERARRAQSEEDGRAATRRFLGSGGAYRPRRD
jgi:P-type conjugative transfer protein TrbJ